MWTFYLIDEFGKQVFNHQEKTRDALESWLVGFGLNAPEDACRYEVFHGTEVVEWGEWPQARSKTYGG